MHWLSFKKIFCRRIGCTVRKSLSTALSTLRYTSIIYLFYKFCGIQTFRDKIQPNDSHMVRLPTENMINWSLAVWSEGDSCLCCSQIIWYKAPTLSLQLVLVVFPENTTRGLNSVFYFVDPPPPPPQKNQNNKNKNP